MPEAYQRQAAGDDHCNDERLEVVVFNKHVSVASHLPEDAPDESIIENGQQ